MGNRDVANKVVYERLTTPGKDLPAEVVLDREALGRKFHPKGRRYTEKQLERVKKHYDKFVTRLKEKIDKSDARAAARAKVKKSGKKGKNPFMPKEGPPKKQKKVPPKKTIGKKK